MCLLLNEHHATHRMILVFQDVSFFNEPAVQLDFDSRNDSLPTMSEYQLPGASWDVLPQLGDLLRDSQGAS